MTKRCSDCMIEKPVTEFHRSGRYLNSKCKPCRSASRKANPREREGHNRNRREKYATDAAYRERIKEKNRLHLYGVDAEWVARRLAEQGGVCASCSAPEPGGHGTWHIDHDHACCPGYRSCGGCIRGLLCGSCNLMLGHAGDDPERLVAAAAYLLSFRDILTTV